MLEWFRATVYSSSDPEIRVGVHFALQTLANEQMRHASVHRDHSQFRQAFSAALNKHHNSQSIPLTPNKVYAGPHASLPCHASGPQASLALQFCYASAVHGWSEPETTSDHKATTTLSQQRPGGFGPNLRPRLQTTIPFPLWTLRFPTVLPLLEAKSLFGSNAWIDAILSSHPQSQLTSCHPRGQLLLQLQGLLHVPWFAYATPTLTPEPPQVMSSVLEV